MLIYPDSAALIQGLNKLFTGRKLYFDQDESVVESGDWLPAVDIKEETGQFTLHMDVPGVDPKDIEVSMENNILTIKGGRQSLQEEKKENYHRIERMKGSFYRRFAFPETADANHIEAETKHGLLKVVIHKKKIEEPRKISIKVRE